MSGLLRNGELTGERSKAAGLSIPVRVSALLAGLLCLLAVPALISPPGAAANYTVIECVPNSVPAPDAVAVQNGSPKIFQDAECVGGQRSGWGLSLEANGLSSRGESRAWAFYAPPGTSFASASALVHQQPGHGYGALYSEDGGTLGFNNEWSTVAVTNTSFFGVSLQCFAASCQSPGQAGDYSLDTGWAFVTHFQADVADGHPPTVHASGSILDGVVARGQSILQASSTDFGGGVRGLTVTVNGVPSVSTDLCEPSPVTQAYPTLRPCPASVDSELTLHTERDPGWTNGPNQVRICARDVAGNTSDCIERTVEVDNSCPASGGQAAEDLSSGIEVAGELRARVRGRSPETPVVRGSLRTSGGTPVQGATVCLYETIALEDGSRQLASTAVTQSNGRFAASLDPGPSRLIDVVYRFNDRILADRLELASSVVPRFK
ncbi:MAG: hypothetical protein ACXWE8_12890, partial [Solirubrobacterales bacterium]